MLVELSLVVMWREDFHASRRVGERVFGQKSDRESTEVVLRRLQLTRLVVRAKYYDRRARARDVVANSIYEGYIDSMGCCSACSL